MKVVNLDSHSPDYSVSVCPIEGSTLEGWTMNIGTLIISIFITYYLLFIIDIILNLGGSNNHKSDMNSFFISDFAIQFLLNC